ncbi:hypothetical protein [Microlunatus sp. Y2014]|uniref:hypothetical protein n=1 Tax=Microlunatus sp. Y2014 TaxID=3418488 RepID=UPI003DA6D070
MSKTTRPARNCTSCSTRLNLSIRAIENPDVCRTCWEQAGLENSHQDGHHDADREGANADCPMCQEATTKIKWARMSHKECGHPLTFADRQACRKAHREAATA